VAPILSGTKSHSQFDIPTYHGSHSGTKSTASANRPAPIPNGSESSIIDFAPADGTSIKLDPALVPTSAGVAPAGKPSALNDMKSLQTSLPKSGASSFSDDNFEDAQEK
jgi:hypothetical protein